MTDNRKSPSSCSIIYEPAGQEGEYAPLATNPYRGCGHAGCDRHQLQYDRAAGEAIPAEFTEFAGPESPVTTDHIMPVKYSGHESFACRYAWLPKSLQTIQADPRAFADEDEAMVELGLGKNMVRSAKFWVEASGMARSTAKGLEPTALGKLIFGGNGRDRFMEDIQTLWLIHWNLSAHVEGPPLRLGFSIQSLART